MYHSGGRVCDQSEGIAWRLAALVALVDVRIDVDVGNVSVQHATCCGDQSSRELRRDSQRMGNAANLVDATCGHKVDTGLEAADRRAAKGDLAAA